MENIKDAVFSGKGGIMSNNYDDRRLLGSPDEDEDAAEERNEAKRGSDEYYDLPPAIRSRTRLWSVISLVLAVLSVLLCPVYYVSLVFSILAVGASLFSRRTLGFFDSLAVIGLIVAIFGFVFGISVMVADLIGLLG